MRELKSDVFIRLSDQKFIKIFHEGDEFGDEDFEKYTQKKKVDFLYIRENESERFVGLYLKDLKKVVQDNQSTVSNVVTLTEEGHQTVQDLIEKVGFTEAVQQITKDQVSMTVQAIQKIPDARALLAKMEETTGKYIPVHSSRLGIVASWFCSAMGCDSAETFTKLCLAAFLHDITLDNDELAKIKTTDELETRKGEFRPDELRAYKEHPMKAVELSRKIKSLPLEVDTILHQHHERYDSKGFPQRLNVRLITPLATAFNMAHDYVDYQIERGKDATLKEFLDMSESWYNQSHYKRIHRQLRTLT
jgi:HD-GYP domain-containing protein (c-di-GMP phosphodiesterase class II)